MTAITTAPAAAPVSTGSQLARIGRFARRNPTMLLGALILIFFVGVAIVAPLIAGDPMLKLPNRRLRPPSPELWFGTDHLGQDVFARVVYGARVSLIVGFSVAAISVLVGLTIGLFAGYYRWFDNVVMRLMDGLMAIPAILLAIAMVALNQGSIAIVVAAISIPELPRVVRLVRSIVLSVKELPFVEAARACGARTPRILFRHIMPSTIAPLIVQATYICASAILVEASLSFLGAGVPPEVPSWGNMIASSRLYLARAPWTIFCPAVALALVVLAVNLLGDGLRDRLDPRLSRRL
ncbi:ABC transporter permease [Bosea sp. BH3]|uniref:ABC transporter permease n=1 Tax=Bosea sp. BH3 TaxID=2871701 RepID=UPI0021CAFBC8|nr:ABC transporter permease [Bosea sp. BH3]MCU4181583.1 ABC transporter permease [Bosea sp. BH3]